MYEKDYSISSVGKSSHLGKNRYELYVIDNLYAIWSKDLNIKTKFEYLYLGDEEDISNMLLVAESLKKNINRLDNLKNKTK